MDYRPYIERLKREKAKERKLREARRSRALHAAKNISALLKKDFGAEKVYLFGSWFEDEYFHLRSDIDLAVQGLTPGKFLRADLLRDLLSFRHLIRNIYSFHIDESEVLEKCRKLDMLSKNLFTELSEFVVFLKKTGKNS